MHDLPMACINEKIGKMIGSTIGQVLACDVNKDGRAWGQSLRIYIELDIEKPLPRGRFINKLGSKIWTSFIYEKMPKICFKCGKISHGDQGRNQKEYMVNEQYGTWLHTQFFCKPLMVTINEEQHPMLQSPAEIMFVHAEKHREKDKQKIHQLSQSPTLIQQNQGFSKGLITEEIAEGKDINQATSKDNEHDLVREINACQSHSNEDRSSSRQARPIHLDDNGPSMLNEKLIGLENITLKTQMLDSPMTKHSYPTRRCKCQVENCVIVHGLHEKETKGQHQITV